MRLTDWIALFCVVPSTLFSSVGAWGAESVYRPSAAPAKEDVYVFGIHPYSNPQDVFVDYEPIMRYIEARLPGTRFQVEASKDYADYERKLSERRFHFSLPNPYQTVVSLKYGYRVIAKMTPDDDFRGLIVARTDRNLNAPGDLSGKVVCFPSATAVAATMLPLLYLHTAGLDVKRDIQVRYVGSQFSSIVNAYSGEAAACGTSVRFWRNWSKENPDKAERMRVVWKTDALPHNAVVARADVDASVSARVSAALVALDKDKSVDQRQFRVDQQHFEAGSNATYQRMQDFLLRYDRAIGLPPTMKK
ncbi:MAG: phosphate/phosphite/phosphonate ABC transporter substrate-binding protein [Gammaproteobacteria bacterium]|nr:phosphate/phosphite/phosphonate ABC transporter substrate-binding protein [Gammaproteobacteria bacterium]